MVKVARHWWKGLRCCAIQVPKRQHTSKHDPPCLLRWSCLGDSVSAGQNLLSNDDAYPRLLATDLHAQLTVYAVPIVRFHKNERR